MADNTILDARRARAIRVLHEYVAWRESNPRAWAYGLGFAFDAKANNRIIGGPAIVAAIRRKDFTDNCGMPTMTNNNFAPIIARDLLREHPELNGAIELRQSRFDEIMGVGTDA